MKFKTYYNRGRRLLVLDADGVISLHHLDDTSPLQHSFYLITQVATRQQYYEHFGEYQIDEEFRLIVSVTLPESVI